jgi:hypothetical protein
VLFDLTPDSHLICRKKQKIAEKRAKAATDAEKRKADFTAGKSVALSGREMFTFNPDLVGEDQMDEGEAAFDSATRQDLDDGVDAVVTLDLDKLAAGAVEVDEKNSSGTIADRKRMYDFEAAAAPTGAINEDLFEDEDEDLLEDELQQAIGHLNIDE